jgi:hypothetical protein
MTDLAESLEAIESKINKLIEKKQQLEIEVSRLNSLNLELQKKESDLEKKIFSISEENKILRIAGNTNTGDSKDMKLKINEMIREVDKCLAQLNQ